MKKILSIIALAGLGIAIYKSYQKSKANKKEIKILN
jgi:hypothetical protein